MDPMTMMMLMQGLSGTSSTAGSMAGSSIAAAGLGGIQGFLGYSQAKKAKRSASDVAEAQQAYLGEIEKLLKQTYGETSAMLEPYTKYAQPVLGEMYSRAMQPSEAIRQQYAQTAEDIARGASARGLLDSGTYELAQARAATEAAARERGAQFGMLQNIYGMSYQPFSQMISGRQALGEQLAGILGQRANVEATRLGGQGQIQQQFLSGIGSTLGQLPGVAYDINRILTQSQQSGMPQGYGDMGVYANTPMSMY